MLFALLTSVAFAPLSHAQISEPGTPESLEYYAGSYASKLSSRIVKKWKKINSGIVSESLLADIEANAMPIYILRYAATSTDGSDLLFTPDRRPVSYVCLTYKGFVLGTASLSESNRCDIQVFKTPELLNGSQSDVLDSEYNEKLKSVVSSKRLFSIIGVDQQDKFFYIENGGLYALDSQSLNPVDVDTNAIASVAYENANSSSRVAVIASSTSAVCVVALLLIIAL